MGNIVKMTAKFVVGYEDGKHVVYEDGEVVYADSEILFVGHAYPGIVDEVWDEGLAIIGPGFIDLEADIDTDHALFDIAIPDDPKERFMMGPKLRTTEPFTPEDFSVRHQYSIAQLIKNGITTAMPISGETFYAWSHSYDEAKIMAGVANQMGMRMYLGPSFRTRATVEHPDDLEREAESVAAAKAFCLEYPVDTESLINSLVNPCQVQVTRLEVLEEMADFARKHNFPYRLHAAEVINEWQYLLPRYGKTSITLFAERKMLFDGCIIPHCAVVTNAELKLLAEHAVNVVITPFAEANFGSALRSFSKYVDYGVNMTIGTDCQPTDMIRNMRMAWDTDRLFWQGEITSHFTTDGSLIPFEPAEPGYPKTTAADYFDAATLAGAKALRRPDLGRLCTGAKADIIVIDLDTLHVGPYHDPIRTLINSCSGADVRHTIINGRVVMKNRELVGVDEEQLRKDAQATFDRYANLYEVYDKEKRPVDELFPPTYTMIKK